MMDLTQMLLALSEKTGVAGREDEAAAFGAELLSEYGRIERTPLGGVLCHVWEGGSDTKLLLDAHIDEIGMIVSFIEDSGFLRVAGCGGVDAKTLPASAVTVHTEGGPLPGVVCSTPPHLDKGGEKKTHKVDELYIDIGCDGEQAKRQVAPGDRVTLRTKPRRLLGGQVSGKAIDDRAGCVAILHALSLLRDETPTCDLTVLFSTMEEVGGQGAKTAAYAVNPTHAIALDVSFAHTPDASREKCGELGKGPMIGFAPLLSHEMSAGLTLAAKQEDIPFQTEVMSGRTSTNADQIAVSRGGVKTALLSIPEKYMHTPIETVLVKDVEDTGKLLAAYIRRMGKGETA